KVVGAHDDASWQLAASEAGWAEERMRTEPRDAIPERASQRCDGNELDACHVEHELLSSEPRLRGGGGLADACRRHGENNRIDALHEKLERGRTFGSGDVDPSFVVERADSETAIAAERSQRPPEVTESYDADGRRQESENSR